MTLRLNRLCISKKHSFAVGLKALVFLVCGHLQAQATTFTDHLFFDPAWSSTIHVNTTTGPVGTQTTLRMGTGGTATSPPFRQTSHNTYGGGQIWVAHLNSAEYVGGVNTIIYSAQLRRPTGQVGQVAYAPLIFQNGRYYRGPTVNASQNGWVHFFQGNLAATDFRLFPFEFGLGPFVFGPRPIPDFSCGAPKMRFGYFTGNSNPLPGTTISTQIDVDDWSVTIMKPAPAIDPDFYLQTILPAGSNDIQVIPIRLIIDL